MCPHVTKEITRLPAPWISNDLKEAIRARDQLQNRLKLDRMNELLRGQFKNEKKRVQALLQAKKKEYFKREFVNCKGNLSNKWKIVHNMIPRANNNASLSNGDNIKEKAEEFNEYFANVGRLAFEITTEFTKC